MRYKDDALILVLGTDMRKMERIVLDGICIIRAKINDPGTGRKKSDESTINVHALCLAFALYIDDTKISETFSDPIYDKKSLETLGISDISCVSSDVNGGAKVMLFCDKVQKGDVKVQFYQIDEHGSDDIWAEIRPNYIHHQVGIRFKTPKYRQMNIDQPVKTFLRLVRPSKQLKGEPISFEYRPVSSC